ncbi:MAG: hypothetical protein MI923_12765 [Phycisphaerales bacterium]|nr:hypothetical protein [Phycisphaerales bacterium]
MELGKRLAKKIIPKTRKRPKADPEKAWIEGGGARSSSVMSGCRFQRVELTVMAPVPFRTTSSIERGTGDAAAQVTPPSSETPNRGPQHFS